MASSILSLIGSLRSCSDDCVGEAEPGDNLPTPRRIVRRPQRLSQSHRKLQGIDAICVYMNTLNM